MALQALQQMAAIKEAYRAVARWRVVASAFYRPGAYQLADLYFGLGLFVLFALAGLATGRPAFIALMLPAMALVLWRLPLALWSVYPMPHGGHGMARAYGAHLRYLRYVLFAGRLERQGVSKSRAAELITLARLESGLAAAHRSPVARPGFAVPVALLVGVLSTGALADHVRVTQDDVLALVCLLIVCGLLCRLFGLPQPQAYRAKELEVFLEWYCLPENMAAPTP